MTETPSGRDAWEYTEVGIYVKTESEGALTPFGTFSHAAHGRRQKLNRLLPCREAWEKVADRPDEGLFTAGGGV